MSNQRELNIKMSGLLSKRPSQLTSVIKKKRFLFPVTPHIPFLAPNKHDCFYEYT